MKQFNGLRRARILAWAGGMACLWLMLSCAWAAHSLPDGSASADQKKEVDLAAWGADHVGKPVPEYLTGDECLFCHRGNIGPAWQTNRHNLTMHLLEDVPTVLAELKKKVGEPIASKATIELGGKRLSRFLNRNPAYGKVDMLSAAWKPPSGAKSGEWIAADNPHWDKKSFADGCVGCHATGVDSTARTFSSPSLDCYTCHGMVDPNHSKDTSMVHLSRKRNDSAQIVMSICAQCHARGGKSRSSGLPYANNFIAGDNLFRDFQVDLSPESIAKLDPGQRHIMENLRDVVVLGKEDTTCLTCHQIHKESTLPHRRLVKSDICLDCHNATGSMKIRKTYEAHSKTCGY